MYTSIYQNSFVILILSFIVLSALFYILQIGYTTDIQPDGKVVKKFSWKYPLAISLILWVIWYFFLFPPMEETLTSVSSKETISSNATSPDNFSYKPNHKINMENWY